MDDDTIKDELKSLRYLMNDLILYCYDIRIKLESMSKTKREYTVPEPNISGDDIAFDLFTIPKDKYKDLIETYGIDVVNKSCTKLDEFIKINEYIPYRTAFNSLKQKFIKEELLNREKKRREEIETKKVKDDIPEHLRGL